MKTSIPFYFILILLFFLACAKQSTPTGGPKDTIPPVLVQSNPKKNAVNVDGRTIELLFSEQVQVKNPKEEIIINPSIGKKFKVEARKNKVFLTNETNFKDSTTYTLNFRESVSDITESNPVKDLKIAFSTGSYVDSLKISGLIVNASNQEPGKEITVGLQPYSDTFSILKHQPTYFTKSDDKGNYTIENLKPGYYLISAINDGNKNLIADTKSERYGFLKDSIFLDGNKKDINLSLVKQDLRPLKITSARPYNTYFNIKTSKNTASYKIESQEKIDMYHAYGADNGTVIIYNTLNNLDSLLITISFTDSIEQKVDTTLYLKFSPKEATPEKFSYTIKSSEILGHRKSLEAEINFTKPLKEVNFDSLFFTVDSLNTIRFEQKDFDYKEPTKTLIIKKDLPANIYTKEPETTEEDGTKKKKPKLINQLYLGKGTFISVEQDSSAANKHSINPKWEENLGLISAETNVKEPVVFELVDKTLKVIRSTYGSKEATFRDLQPGEYMLRVIIDRNGNHQWDAGNYLKKQEPERIIYYQGEKGDKIIKLKENFEIGPLLISY